MAKHKKKKVAHHRRKSCPAKPTGNLRHLVACAARKRCMKSHKHDIAVCKRTTCKGLKGHARSKCASKCEHSKTHLSMCMPFEKQAIAQSLAR